MFREKISLFSWSNSGILDSKAFLRFLQAEHDGDCIFYVYSLSSLHAGLPLGHDGSQTDCFSVQQWVGTTDYSGAYDVPFFIHYKLYDHSSLNLSFLCGYRIFDIFADEFHHCRHAAGIFRHLFYDFIWDTYCDWYIELTKTRLYGEDQEAKLAAQNVLCYVLLRVLELLHPFMPFITEEIWQALPHQGEYLIRAPWPTYREEFAFAREEQAMEAVKDAISAVRARRAEMIVPPSRKAKIIIASQTPEIYADGRDFITRLAYASEVEVGSQAPQDLNGMVTVSTHDATMYLPLAELVDIEKELERIQKELTKARENLERIEKKLQNESFVSKAPEAVVNAEREKADKARALIAKLEESAQAMHG